MNQLIIQVELLTKSIIDIPDQSTRCLLQLSIEVEPFQSASFVLQHEAVYFLHCLERSRLLLSQSKPPRLPNVPPSKHDVSVLVLSERSR